MDPDKDDVHPSTQQLSVRLALRSFAPPAPVEKWRMVVQHYANLSLTNEGDVFPALQGLAMRMHDECFRTSAYLAGLWEQSIIADLSWYYALSREKNDLPMRPQTWRAPSWSWASLKNRSDETAPTNGHLMWANPATKIEVQQRTLRDHETLYATYLGASIDPAGESQFGALSSAKLRLKSRWIEVKLFKRKLYYSAVRNLKERRWIRSVFDWEIHQDFAWTKVFSAYRLAEGTSLKIVFLGDNESNGSYKCVGLILRELEDLVYERVGLATISRATSEIFRVAFAPEDIFEIV
ncbi:hypothetical protein N0V90_003480 [Kalmusia sp. IMI 367209]|nr:hypothetical protein N0V90_003480 [Kalmusia sp. IMI 367209]